MGIVSFGFIGGGLAAYDFARSIRATGLEGKGRTEIYFIELEELDNDGQEKLFFLVTDAPWDVVRAVYEERQKDTAYLGDPGIIWQEESSASVAG